VDNFSENFFESKSKFERSVISYLTLCTKDNNNGLHDIEFGRYKRYRGMKILIINQLTFTIYQNGQRIM